MGNPTWETELAPDALAQPPSERVRKALLDSFDFTRRNTWRLRAISATGVVLAVLLLAAICAGILAVQRERQRTETLSKSDFLQASRLIGEDQAPQALAYLARSLTLQPDNRAAADRLFTLLSQHNFPRPLSDSVDEQLLTASSTQEGTSPDGKRHYKLLNNNESFQLSANGKAIGSPVKLLTTAWSPNRVAVFSPDSLMLATTLGITGAGYARLWDTATALPVSEAMYVPDRAMDASFVKGGERLAVSMNQAPTQLWDIRNGRAHGDVLQTTGSLALFRDDHAICSLIASSEETPSKPILSPKGNLTLQISPDNEYAAEVGGKALLHQDNVYCASFSPDGSKVATASNDLTARIWNAATGKPLGEPLQHQSPVRLARFSPDGTRLLTVTGSGDTMDEKGGDVQVWDVTTGAPLCEPIKHGRWVEVAYFTQDGRRVVTIVGGESGPKYVRVWDIGFGSETPVPEWLPAMAESVGGFKITENGVLGPVDDRAGTLSKLDRKLKASQSSDSFVLFGKWYLEDRATRNISPWVKTSMHAFVDDCQRIADPLLLEETNWLPRAKGL